MEEYKNEENEWEYYEKKKKRRYNIEKRKR